MTTALLTPEAAALELVNGLVLDALSSLESKCAYSKALDDFLGWWRAGRAPAAQFNRALVNRYRRRPGIARPALLTRLATAEAELATVTKELEAHRPVDVSATIDEMKGFVTKNLMQLRNLLREDAPAAKTALTKHIEQLVLIPEDRPSGAVFAVSGGVDVLRSDVMPEVARDRIAQHYTCLTIPFVGFHLDPALELRCTQ